MKKNILRYGLLMLCWLAYSHPLLADPNDPEAEDDPPAPIDDFIIVLFLAAIVVGIYFLIRHRRSEMV